MPKVNIDALIPREDFEAEENPNPGKKKGSISIEDLKSTAFFYSSIRKPDFQRETNEWDDDKVAEFVSSFINGDLIPAVILWRSASGYLFVIDGSHRISSLVAWINNDFGDGTVSKFFYDGVVPEEQIEIAEKCKIKVRKKIGLYDDYVLALTNPEKVDAEIVKKVKNLGALAIQLQWVEGDANKAEHSFFKINQQAAPIDKTELVLLESRKKPNCIAARAIIRGGKGHKYWDKFTSEYQSELQTLADEIHNILFSPKLETPIKTLDIPIGGKNYSGQTLPLILDFVNIVNDIPSDFNSTLADDTSGEETTKCLKTVRQVARLINSNHPSSLGLHPIVYFYSQDGRHKIASFLAVVAFILDLKKRGKFADFISVRKEFEAMLIEYDYLIQQINRKFRSAKNSYQQIKIFYLAIIQKLLEKKSLPDAVNKIIESEAFDYLTLQIDSHMTKPPDFRVMLISGV
ncbi:MAG: DUF262 domain-containing protein [Nitrospinae bacterium]|nr:DUF262 domain-containing protein [Nitrospinota bacterium]MBL7019768.1 DUF262 domain-containing protein [Nitrospinaceae bacterium]